MEVIEQITNLLFLRRLDMRQQTAEQRAIVLETPIENPIYGDDEQHLRWSHFRQLDPEIMFDTVSNEVFPWLRNLGARIGGTESTYAEHMRDARFTIPKPSLLQRVVDLITNLNLDDRDTNGDLYEYMLAKLSTSGQNGQFRTPRHIIQLMVQLTKPTPTDTICDMIINELSTNGIMYPGRIFESPYTDTGDLKSFTESQLSSIVGVIKHVNATAAVPA